MTDQLLQLRNEARYAERLCQRTARLYRRVQTTGTFLAVLGGSGALSAVSGQVAGWIPIAGGALLTLVGAALVAIRPADKAASNEVDMRRYSALLASGHNMDARTFAQALDEARRGDMPEVELLRNPAWNDVVCEIGASDKVVKLRPSERLVAALA